MFLTAIVIIMSINSVIRFVSFSWNYFVNALPFAFLWSCVGISSSFNAWVWVILKCCLIYDAGVHPNLTNVLFCKSTCKSHLTQQRNLEWHPVQLTWQYNRPSLGASYWDEWRHTLHLKYLILYMFLILWSKPSHASQIGWRHSITLMYDWSSWEVFGVMEE